MPSGRVTQIAPSRGLRPELGVAAGLFGNLLAIACESAFLSRSGSRRFGASASSEDLRHRNVPDEWEE